jgi:hypothetical protein
MEKIEHIKLVVTKAQAFYFVMGLSMLADKARLDGACKVEEKALTLILQLTGALQTDDRVCQHGQNWRSN